MRPSGGTAAAHRQLCLVAHVLLLLLVPLRWAAVCGAHYAGVPAHLCADECLTALERRCAAQLGTRTCWLLGRGHPTLALFRTERGLASVCGVHALALSCLSACGIGPATNAQAAHISLGVGALCHRRTYAVLQRNAACLAHLHKSSEGGCTSLCGDPTDILRRVDASLPPATVDYYGGGDGDKGGRTAAAAAQLCRYYNCLGRCWSQHARQQQQDNTRTVCDAQSAESVVELWLDTVQPGRDYRLRRFNIDHAQSFCAAALSTRRIAHTFLVYAVSLLVIVKYYLT